MSPSVLKIETFRLLTYIACGLLPYKAIIGLMDSGASGTVSV